jgi:hypothetical protein
MPLVAMCLTYTMLVCSWPSSGAGATGAGARPALHPIHTTITTLTYDPVTAMAMAQIRAFADDLSHAVAQRAVALSIKGQVVSDPGADTGIIHYAESRFTIAGADGRPLPLKPCGVRSSADLRWICLQTKLPGGLSGVRVADALLTDLYVDQVNVVIAEDGRTGTRSSLLFTPGDKPKAVTTN